MKDKSQDFEKEIQRIIQRLKEAIINGSGIEITPYESFALSTTKIVDYLDSLDENNEVSDED